VFYVYRAAIVALATFVSAIVGFSLQWLLPAAYVADSKGMIGSVVGLVAALLSLVLGLLIWTSHGLFAEQQSQLLTVGAAFIRFDFALKAFGPEAVDGRALLREHAERTYQRFWSHARDGRSAYADLDRDIEAMQKFFEKLRLSKDDQSQRFATATEHFGKIVETQRAMVRTLGSKVPTLLLDVVAGWACALFFFYGVQSAVNGLTIFTAAVGATSVASAVFLILELSNPYTGLLQAPHTDFDWLLQILAKESEILAKESEIQAGP
jgi:hypothetical protein